MNVSLDAIGFPELSLFILLISVESSNIWLIYVQEVNKIALQYIFSKTSKS